VQASSELDVYSQQRVLHMVNDYTGATEIGSLFLSPEYRRDGIGKFLSRSRFLMLAELPHLFSDIVISEIRGVQDEHGDSPFYKNLAQNFFQMDFKRADFIHATQGGQFISDLMPKYPIYVNLLPPKARNIIGLPLEASRPAMHLLEKEGFRYQGYIDVFDAGPTMQGERSSIRTVRKSKSATITEIAPIDSDKKYIVSSTSLPDFRVAFTELALNSTGVTLSQHAVDSLKLKKGSHIRYYDYDGAY
jgi:arginine N-succinyltransferase